MSQASSPSEVRQRGLIIVATILSALSGAAVTRHKHRGGYRLRGISTLDPPNKVFAHTWTVLNSLSVHIGLRPGRVIGALQRRSIGSRVSRIFIAARLQGQLRAVRSGSLRPIITYEFARVWRTFRTVAAAEVARGAILVAAATNAFGV